MLELETTFSSRLPLQELMNPGSLGVGVGSTLGQFIFEIEILWNMSSDKLVYNKAVLGNRTNKTRCKATKPLHLF